MRRSPVRSVLFALAYWTLSFVYATAAAIAALAPGRAPVAAVLRFYTRRMLWAEHWIAGIRFAMPGPSVPIATEGFPVIRDAGDRRRLGRQRPRDQPAVRRDPSLLYEADRAAQRTRSCR